MSRRRAERLRVHPLKKRVNSQLWHLRPIRISTTGDASVNQSTLHLPLTVNQKLHRSFFFHSSCSIMALSPSFFHDFSITSPDVLAVIFAISAYAAWRVYSFVSFVYRTPLRILPGPPVASLVYGNLKEIQEVEGSFLPDRWFTKYGKNYVDHEFFLVSIRVDWGPIHTRYLLRE